MGRHVYQEAPYNNGWNGQSNGKMILTGDEVVNGTYFYVLKLNDEIQPLSGSLELKRLTRFKTFKTMKKSNYILLLIALLCSINSQAQDQFSLSQYMLHQPFMNPASISSYGNVNGALLYKKQWVSLEGAPEVQAFSINSPFKKGSNNHVGLTVIHDKIGVNNNYNIAATYAYGFKDK